MIGILGGTSFRDTDELRQGSIELVATPFGRVPVTLGEGVAMITRHGVDGYTPPHRINHHAHLKALQQVGVERIVSFGSVGGLVGSYHPGKLVVVDDLYAPHRVVTYHHDQIHFTVPRFDQEWRRRVVAGLHSVNLQIKDGGTYAETLGPRFETKAEIAAISKHAHVVGMTCASEAILAQELGIPLVILAMVDNWANGVSNDPLIGEEFEQLVRENRDTVLRAFQAVMELR